jgi:hypothetical protein
LLHVGAFAISLKTIEGNWEFPSCRAHLWLDRKVQIGVIFLTKSGPNYFNFTKMAFVENHCKHLLAPGWANVLAGCVGEETNSTVCWDFSAARFLYLGLPTQTFSDHLVKSIWNQVVPGKFNLVRDYSKAENTFKCQAIQDQPAGQRNQKRQETHCWEISTNHTSQINIQCYWFPHPPRQNIGSTWCQQMFAVIFDKSHFGEVIWSRFCHKYDPDLNFSVQPEVGSTRWKLSISVNSL